eukprot:TRINITY_DN215_c0_g7_i1.p1 TRINITY_DN215_c0_g7~~TRINITY_DN215_c0_g7_i1.p1  ORF type:complete len:701 (+),score=316.45 TRINITY_DN215_c0_g7_i1:65-2104(+)
MSSCRFHHTQMFQSELKPLAEYKKLEADLCTLAAKGSYDPFSGGMRFLDSNALPERVKEGREMWKTISDDVKDPEEFKSNAQDIVEQLIVGAGWRVTAEYVGPSTRSLLVCSNDPCGQKCVVTSKIGDNDADEPYHHFRAAYMDTFRASHVGRDGIAVLGFELDADELESCFKNYELKHPKLLVNKSLNKYRDSRHVTSNGTTKELDFGTFTSFDVCAYYLANGEADLGTVVRFSSRTGAFAHKAGFGNPQGVLPGFEDVPAKYDGTSIAAYSDHWVSNVLDRKSFLKTLEDVLGFTPKVDFNAGVVAAGEAIIESTVTGNTSTLNTTDMQTVFEDQSQVYLPINNALSEVGHVFGFINEMGQGVQHLACRVADLTMFVERVNNYRKMTGKGFSFLKIPRSYYGRLTEKDLVAAGCSEELANAVVAAMIGENKATPTGVVNLEITDDEIKAIALADAVKKEFDEKLSQVVEVVKRSRYVNMYKLLKDHINEGTYLKIVTNQVLVDIQGQDILYQIFTSNILQKNAGEEAPFFEFIQRVCSASVCSADGKPLKIRPGCGGFGIRNFLTLFLSIEVSKAMLGVEEAVKAGDEKTAAKQNKVVDALTAQLEESNPILTGISDAMTAEADHLDFAAEATNEEDKAKHLAKAEEFRKEKEHGNELLKETSDRYKALLSKIRTEE